MIRLAGEIVKMEESERYLTYFMLRFCLCVANQKYV